MKNITKILFMFVVVTLLVTMTSCSKKYSVKFMSDDEIYKEVEVKKDATVENVAISKEGYEFAGWFLGEDLFDFNTKITENIELTANGVKMIQKIIFTPSFLENLNSPIKNSK